MFIECPRHKSKMQRSLLYCIERCNRKCDAFYAVDPKRIAKALAEHPEAGKGHQLTMFPLADPPPRRSRKKRKKAD